MVAVNPFAYLAIQPIAAPIESKKQGAKRHLTYDNPVLLPTKP
jgi:hypothetical protein